MSIACELARQPLVTDGTIMTTSCIVAVKSGRVVTKSGSSYELGDVDPEYERQFLNAKVRVLHSIKE